MTLLSKATRIALTLGIAIGLSGAALAHDTGATPRGKSESRQVVETEQTAKKAVCQDAQEARKAAIKQVNQEFKTARVAARTKLKTDLKAAPKGEAGKAARKSAQAEYQTALKAAQAKMKAAKVATREAFKASDCKVRKNES